MQNTFLKKSQIVDEGKERKIYKSQTADEETEK